MNSLGRHPNNSIQLLDKIVSKEHCIIEQRGEVFVLRDLGSLNGTYINGERVRGEGVLKHGDEISLGATRARFDDGSGHPLPPGAAAPPIAWQPATPATTGPGSTGGAQVPGRVLPTAIADAGPAGGSPSPLGGAGFPGPGLTGASPPGSRDKASPTGGFPASHAATASIAEASPRAAPGVSPPGWQQRSAALVRPSAPPRPGGPSGPPRSRPGYHGTRIDVQEQERSIGTQIAATQKGFLPFEQIMVDSAQVRADYERLRLSHELSREIALERDTTKLLEKILASIFKFIHADRGVIFLQDLETGELIVGASRRRDGTERRSKCLRPS